MNAKTSMCLMPRLFTNLRDSIDIDFIYPLADLYSVGIFIHDFSFILISVFILAMVLCLKEKKYNTYSINE